MIAEYGGNLPKKGDCVRIGDQAGLFEVVEVNVLLRTANLKSTDGKGDVTHNVSWISLRFQRAASR